MTAEPKVRSKNLVINDRVTVPARDLSWTASRASGPGGQTSAHRGRISNVRATGCVS
jgi:hypothetical protein